MSGPTESRDPRLEFYNSVCVCTSLLKQGHRCHSNHYNTLAHTQTHRECVIYLAMSHLIDLEMKWGPPEYLPLIQTFLWCMHMQLFCYLHGDVSVDLGHWALCAFFCWFSLFDIKFKLCVFWKLVLSVSLTCHHEQAMQTNMFDFGLKCYIFLRNMSSTTHLTRYEYHHPTPQNCFKEDQFKGCQVIFSCIWMFVSAWGLA